MIVLNAAVAAQLTQFKKDVDDVIKAGRTKDEAIFQILKKYILESEKVLFEGDGYSDEWHKEAKKRGLSNIESVPESVKQYLTDQGKKVLIGTGIFSEKELASRCEVEYEKFTKKTQIEARVLGDLAINHIVPTAITYMTSLIENVRGLREIFNDTEFERLAGARKEVIVTVSDHISNIKRLVNDMVEARKRANKIEGAYEQSLAYEKDVKPYLDEVRYHIDKLELIVDNEIWPLPKYRELLFTR
jgi:glutamine synthetase